MSLAGSVAFAADPSTQEMAQQIKSLQQQVTELKAQTQQNQADVTAAIQQVLADADRHSQLLDTGAGVTAGWANNRFFIGSEDGNYTLKPWFHLQIRDSTAWRQKEKPNGNDDVQNGFEIRRARFGFDGNLFGQDFTYFINWATYRGNSTGTVTNNGATVGTVPLLNGGLPVLEEAWVKYHFPDSPYAIRVGQMHDPLDHENIVGSKIRYPEASLQGDIFGNTDTFTQAATFIYDNGGAIRFEGGVTDGIRAANTNFEDSPNNGIAYDGGVAGRVEYKLMGDWADYSKLSSLGDKKDLLVLGSGVDESWGGDFNSLSHTLDLQYANPNGWFAYVCYLGRYTQNNPGIPLGAPVSTSFGGAAADKGKDTYESSFDAQVAYLINGNIEPYVRYEYLYLHGTPAGSHNSVNDISLGVNYYFKGNNLKFTGQVMYLPNGIPINDDGSDVLISNGRGEVVFITQINLLL
jgi:hypothetical protein